MLLASLISNAQEKLKFSEAVKLGTGVNTEAEESLPILSSDGKTLYFVRSLYKDNLGGKTAGQDVWVSTTSGSDFTEAAPTIGLINNNNNNAIIGISQDAKKLYLLNQYSGKNKMKVGLSELDVISDAPVIIDIEIPELEVIGDFYGFYMHPDGKVLLISANMKSSTGEEDLWVSFKNDKGEWSVPKNLGTTINTTNYEMSPFLSEDGKTLYFSTAGRGGFGSADIFMVKRMDESWTKWSVPQNLGNKINSRGFDAYFFRQGNKVLFCSNRAGDFSDIYMANILTQEELNALLPPSKTIYFVLNGSMLDGKSKPILDEVVEILKNNGDLKVEITGFTCSLGDETGNKKLSKTRAGSAGDYLLVYGISEDRIVVKGDGESKSHLESAEEETQKQFRKVEIKFSYIE